MVEDSFPRYERPGLKDMEEYTDCALGNEPIPARLELKVSSKPTKEMVDDFCKRLGLSVSRNSLNGDYLFRLEKFFIEEQI